MQRQENEVGNTVFKQVEQQRQKKKKILTENKGGEKSTE